MSKTINDYVLEQLEKISNTTSTGTNLKEELLKAETVSKLAKISIEEREAEIKSKELDMKKQILEYQFNKAPNKNVSQFIGIEGSNNEKI